MCWLLVNHVVVYELGSVWMVCPRASNVRVVTKHRPDHCSEFSDTSVLVKPCRPGWYRVRWSKSYVIANPMKHVVLSYSRVRRRLCLSSKLVYTSLTNPISVWGFYMLVLFGRKRHDRQHYKELIGPQYKIKNLGRARMFDEYRVICTPRTFFGEFPNEDQWEIYKYPLGKLENPSLWVILSLWDTYYVCYINKQISYPWWAFKAKDYYRLTT